MNVIIIDPGDIFKSTLDGTAILFLPRGLGDKFAQALLSLSSIGVAEVSFVDKEQVVFRSKEGGELSVIDDTASSIKEAMHLYHWNKEYKFKVVKKLGSYVLVCPVCNQEHEMGGRIAKCDNRNCESHKIRKIINPSYLGLC
ncbi:hypothetical protein HY249_01060 [Candidatus Azambacteria bacterium]|nr:hypothetical protein [Candidatus Azambacteria bacterium]